MRSEVFNHLLEKLDIHPVLIDVGASGAPPEIWQRIAQLSIYVGFDPDLREIQEMQEVRFYKAIILNEAVTSDKESDEVLFYFTKSPFCSSTLKPDHASLSNYLFSDLFTVERRKKVRATSLDAVIERLSLTGIDWFKTDSQGTDLRLFNSLKFEVRSRVLAVDIEPGLIDAYHGEDLFVDVHKDLTRNGFWLSSLAIGGAVRMRRSTLSEVITLNKGITGDRVEKAVRKSPAWVEARYLRTIEWLVQGNFTKREYVLLWTFGLLDGQIGFALDLAIEYEKIFERDDISEIMKEEPILRLKRSGDSMLFSIAKSLFPVRTKRWLKKFIKRRVSL